VIAYAPKTAETEKLVETYLQEQFTNALGLFGSSSIRFEGYNDEATIEDMHVNTPIAAAIVFKLDAGEGSELGLSTDMNDVKYSIRMAADLPEYYSWLTAVIFPNGLGSKPERDVSNPYIGSSSHNGFLFLQAGVERALARHFHPQNLPPSVYARLKSFPYPEFEEYGFITISGGIVTFFVGVISVMIGISNMIVDVVSEKKERQKEVMKMMGASARDIWLSWIIKWLLTFFIISLLVTFALCVMQNAVIKFSSGFLFFVLYLSYTYSAVAFGLWISTLFQEPTIASLGGSVLLYITYLPWDRLSTPTDYNTGVRPFDSLTSGAKCGLALMPMSSIGMALDILGRYEIKGQGATFQNAGRGPNQDEDFGIGHIIGMLWVGTIIWSLLAWYCDNVIQGEFGTAKGYLFFLGCSSPDDAQIHESDTQVQFDNNVGIKIDKVVKTWMTPEGPKKAVDNLNLDVNKGEITVLLGHNGAGKTTAMSIMCGMYPPTSGSVLINGHNVSTNMDSARESLGLCPQFDIIWKKLSVRQHLRLYCKLKGIDDEKFIEQEIQTFLVDLDLKEKEHELAETLSGGQKRCLSCSIALIGGSKTVILDEPTSGMDPEKRRLTWKLIAKHRKGRTILLTTHFMDEADLLGDRIAIMHHGALAAAGSSLELKRQYGSGYKLTVAKGASFNDGGLATAVAGCVDDAQVVANSLDSEVCYNLPDASVGKFPALFKTLEAKEQELGLDNFGVSCTTMEEVFLRVGDEGLPEGDESAGMEENEFLLGKTRVGEDGVGIDTEKEGGCSLWSQQFRALFYKRAINAKRNPWATGLSIWMPVILMMVGFFTAKFGAVSDMDKQAEACRSLSFDEFTKTQTVYLSGDDTDYDKFSDMQPSIAAAEAAFGAVPTTPVETDLFNRASQYVTAKNINQTDFTGESFSGSLLEKFDGFTTSLVFENDKVGATFGQGVTWITKVDGVGCQYSSYPEYSAGTPKISTAFAGDEIKLRPGVWYTFGFDPTLNPSTSPSCFLGACVASEATLTTGAGEELWTTGEDYRVGNGIDTSNVPAGVEIIGHLGYASLNISKFFESETEEREENNAEQSAKESADAAMIAQLAPKLVGAASRAPFLRVKFAAGSASTLSLSCDVTGADVVISAANITTESADTVFVPPTTVAFGWYTRQMVHTAPEALNFIGNVIAKSHLGNPDVEFKAEVCPLPKSLQQQSTSLAVSGDVLQVALMAIFGMAAFVATLVLFPFDERKSHAKHVQFVSGANDMVYWLSSFTWDFILGFAVCVLATAIAAAVNLDTFNGELLGHYFAILVLTLWGAIPLMYILATILPTESKATTFAITFFFFYMASIICFFVVVFVGLFNQNELVKERLDKADLGLMINPVYAMARAVYTLSNNKAQLDLVARVEAEGFSLEQLGVEIDYVTNYWSLDKGGIGTHAIFLGVQGFAYWFILLFVEWSSRRQGSKQGSDATDFAGDDDVDKERHRIRTGGATDVVVVKGISKAFGGGMQCTTDCDGVAKRRGTCLNAIYALLTCGFSNCIESPAKKKAVKDLTFGIPAGECFGLLGVNGAGKTTTFEMLTGEKTLSSGSVEIKGMDIASHMQEIRQHIGYCPQYDGLVGSLTGREALAMFARLRGVPEAKIAELVESAVNALALKKFADQCCGTYSGGNKRKLSTAIAIIGAPDIIFLDEPTSGMDPKSRRYLWNVLLAIKRSGKIIVLTSHSMEECEALCSKVVIMKEGQFQCFGSPTHLKAKYGSGYTVTARLERDASGNPANTADLKAMFNSSFPQALFEKDVYGEVSYTLPKDTLLSTLFEVLESKKGSLKIEDYSVAQTSLEQVFLKFASSDGGNAPKSSTLIVKQPETESDVVTLPQNPYGEGTKITKMTPV